MFFAVWFCLAGCRPEAPTAPKTLPLEDQTVELLVPADLALRETWEPLLQEWHVSTGGNTDWSEYDAGNPPWKHGAALGARPNGGRIVLVPVAELSDADAFGLLSPFPAEVAAVIDGKDIFPGLKEAVLSRQKRLVAAPVSVPVLMCYYRKDLLEAAGRTPPETWDEYQQLLEDLSNWAPGLSALEPCGPEFRASLFLARTAAYCKHPQNYSVWFDIQTGMPLFDYPGMERALDTARRAWSLMPAETWDMTPADCRRALLDGRAALALSWEPLAGYPRTAPSSAAAESTGEPLPVGIALLPGSNAVYHRDAKRWDSQKEGPPHQPGFTGFTGLALVVSAGENRSAAWNLLQLLTKHQDEAFVVQARSPCRESDVLSSLPETSEISRETASLAVDATAVTLRRRDVVCDLAIPQAQDVRRIIAQELEAARGNSRETKDILAALQASISSGTEEHRESLRDAYRRSLGLPALKELKP